MRALLLSLVTIQFFATVGNVDGAKDARGKTKG